MGFRAESMDLGESASRDVLWWITDAGRTVRNYAALSSPTLLHQP
jgi:hypothetical protein